MSTSICILEEERDPAKGELLIKQEIPNSFKYVNV